MFKYTLTNRAVKDLSDIWNYTYDNWSEKQADKYYSDILKKCSSVVKKPNEGKIYFRLMDDVKGIKIHKHIIFYRQLKNEIIEVARILHERMDLKRRLEE